MQKYTILVIQNDSCLTFVMDRELLVDIQLVIEEVIVW